MVIRSSGAALAPSLSSLVAVLCCICPPELVAYGETVLQEAAMACDIPANVETVVRFLSS